MQPFDIVVAERYGDAATWCIQNGLDQRLAAASHQIDIRLMRLRKPLVKVLG